jgi:hypothetical protein
LKPKYDSQEEIHPTLLNLDKANALIDTSKSSRRLIIWRYDDEMEKIL